MHWKYEVVWSCIPLVPVSYPENSGKPKQFRNTQRVMCSRAGREREREKERERGPKKKGTGGREIDLHRSDFLENSTKKESPRVLATALLPFSPSRDPPVDGRSYVTTQRGEKARWPHVTLSTRAIYATPSSSSSLRCCTHTFNASCPFLFLLISANCRGVVKPASFYISIVRDLWLRAREAVYRGGWQCRFCAVYGEPDEKGAL